MLPKPRDGGGDPIEQKETLVDNQNTQDPLKGPKRLDDLGTGIDTIADEEIQALESTHWFGLYVSSNRDILDNDARKVFVKYPDYFIYVKHALYVDRNDKDGFSFHYYDKRDRAVPSKQRKINIPTGVKYGLIANEAIRVRVLGALAVELERLVTTRQNYEAR